MVKINSLYLAAIAATFSSTILAAPKAITAELTFPNVHVGRENTEARCINCENVCKASRAHGAEIPDWKVCSTVCAGKENVACVYMDKAQQKAYFTAYYGENYESIPGLVENFQSGAHKRSAIPMANLAIESDLDGPVRLEKRGRVKVNCKNICSATTNVYNVAACDDICRGEENDCKEKLNKDETRRLLEHYYPGEASRKYHDCKKKGKCISDFLFKDYPELKGTKHSHDC